MLRFLANQVLSCLGERVCFDSTANIIAVAKRIKKLADSGQPVFLVLRADVISGELLNLICSTWPDLCVFLYTDKMNEQQLSAQFPPVQLVQPALVEDEEADARIGWGDCMRTSATSNRTMPSDTAAEVTSSSKAAGITGG